MEDSKPASIVNDEQLRSIDEELQQVERGLDLTPVGRQHRSSIGRTGMLNSIQSALGDIRTHLDQAQQEQQEDSVSSSDARSQSLSQLSERLRTAELAHSTGIPLGLLLRGNFINEQRQSTRDRLLRGTSLTRSKSEGSGLERDAAPSRRQQFAQERRPSALVASRIRANQAAGFQVDLDLHENGAGLIRPLEELMEEQDHDDDEDMVEQETPMLLTKRQKLFMSSGSLSGSLHLPENSSGSIVYSWGAGVQSLHDDDDTRTVDKARLSKESRIGRPGSAAVLSVATSATHTACATVQGEVLTCGLNREGAVDPDRRDQEIIRRPALLDSLGQTRVLQVSCGLDHTAALTDSGSVLTWGSNKEGQLGHRPTGDTASTSFCRPRGMLLSGGRRAAAVACGHGFTLVLTTRMSLLACGIPEMSGYHKEDNHHIPSPIPAVEGLPLVSVAAGNRHAAVLTIHGTVFAWGNNSSGCCGRPYPESVTLPVPVHVPDSALEKPDGPNPFPNWAVWNGSNVSLADDVAVVHAACGDEHTVLVTRSGRLLCCGRNNQGQIGLASKESVTSVQPVEHPQSSAGRHFVTAEAGDGHTLLLDDLGDVWEMGNCKMSGPEAVLTGKGVLAIACGGDSRIAIAPGGRGALRRQFSVTSDSVVVEGSLIAHNMEELLESVKDETEDDDLSLSGRELAKRTEELLSYPASLNSLFMDPSELALLYEKLISVGNTQTQQAVATAIERGIKTGLEKLRPDNARMMYPESVRCLLLYIKFFDRDTADTEVVFDRLGDCISALCETILSLPFEGYKALLTWATSIYPRDLFVSMLVQPLLVQLEYGLEIDVGDNGVEHIHLSRRAIPVIVAVLRWLHSASERVDDIASPQDFYSSGISKIPTENLYNDLAQLKRASKSQRATNFFLCANPFLMSPATKRDLIFMENQTEMVKVITQNVQYDAEHGVFTIDPYFALEIEREHLLHQTLDSIKKASPSDLRKKLNVVFKGEEGVDAGGVTKEFFQLLSESLFDVSSGMWTDRFGPDVTWFNSDCSWDSEGYELVGVLVGLAVYNSVLLDVHFPTAVYRKLLGLPLGLEDMVDEELKKGFQQLLDYDGDDVEYVFCMAFEVTWANLGQEQKIELKPNGSNIPVTSNNKEEYVLLYVKWLLVDSIQPQWDAFEKGFQRIMDASSLDLFRPEELELLVVGTPELDFDALEANTEYEGGYDKESPVVINFWRFVKEASREEQLKFLKFATGSPKAPIGGLGALSFKIQRAGPDSPQLPTSHTCFNTMLIPDYGDDYDKLSERLGRAILECEGFGLQ